MGELSFGGASGVIILCCYAVLMLGIGVVSYRRQSDVGGSVDTYFLAGRGLGFVALFFTLYATQYSGNTVIGYAPAAYRQGFPWWQSVMFFTFIVAVYLLFAPRLYPIARREGFVTPVDWIRHRFDHVPLTVLSLLLMLWGLGNYLVEQMVAMGQGIAGLTGGTIPFEIGVVGFVIVMLAYSWLGGMEAVAFTDVMQGIALLVGITVLVIGGFTLVDGNLAAVTEHLLANEPAKAAVPPLEVSAGWLSLVLIVGFGAAVYPHAIQRIYAAESERTLKRSLGFMALMPPITAGAVFLVGIIGIDLYPGLSESESEQLVGMIANQVAGINGFFFVAMILLFGGVIAAIVSTADSALLSFSSMISRDLYAGFINRDASERRQVRVGKAGEVVTMAVVLLIAWNPPGTLYEIFVLKFELIAQLAPAFIMGIYWPRLSARPVFLGMLAGALLAGGLTVAGVDAIFGFGGGLIGLLLNVAICVVGSRIAPATTEQVDRAERASAVAVVRS